LIVLRGRDEVLDLELLNDGVDTLLRQLALQVGLIANDDLADLVA